MNGFFKRYLIETLTLDYKFGLISKMFFKSETGLYTTYRVRVVTAPVMKMSTLKIQKSLCNYQRTLNFKNVDCRKIMQIIL